MPELDEVDFFQQCVEQNCLLTLHLASQFKLAEAGTDLDEQVAVGLEVSRWIMKLQVKDPDVSSKLVLLIGTYLKLFVEEFQRLELRGRMTSSLQVSLLSVAGFVGALVDSFLFLFLLSFFSYCAKSLSPR